MAQGDLYKLLKRVSNELARQMDTQGKGSERFRERVGRFTHDVHISRDAIRDEILITLNDFKLSEQLTKERGEKITQGARRAFGSATGATREQASLSVRALATTEGLTSKQIKLVELEADVFVESALAVIRKPPGGIKVTKIAGDNKNFTLRFTPVRKNAKVFEAINKSIFKPAKMRLAKNLNRADFAIDLDKERRIFNVGHVTAVSTLKGARAIAAVSRGVDKITAKYTDPVGNEAVDTIKMSILSKFSQLGNPDYIKDFVNKMAVVMPESEATNIVDSDYEAAVLRDVKKSLENALKKMPIEWASQQSSDSLIDAISKDLVQKALKSTKSKDITVKVPKLGGKKQGQTQSPTILIKLKREKKPTTNVTLSSFGALDLPNPFKGRLQGSSVSMAAMIPMLNERLPDIIRSHMGKAGRLHNRTGRFSESAQIQTIDEENFTLGYTYQMFPYSIFESQGSRDPRPLIEMSIRQAAAGIMSTRFGIRRL